MTPDDSTTTAGLRGDRTVVVTGAGGLIGACTARLVALQGAPVAVADVSADKAVATVEAITRAGGCAVAFPVDIADENAVEVVFAEIAAQLPAVGGLVNCATPLSLVPQERPIADLEVALWDEIMRVALRGTMLCTRAGVRAMLAAGGGSIVSVSSIHAVAGDTATVAYPAAKAALVALTRSVATQYGRHGVRSNVVSPGTIAHPGMSAADLDRRLRHQVIGRAGRPEDVAAAIAFLLSEAASFITGQVLTVDGGTLIHLPTYADGGSVIAPDVAALEAPARHADSEEPS